MRVTRASAALARAIRPISPMSTPLGHVDIRLKWTIAAPPFPPFRTAIPAFHPVIPAFHPVIPAKAGIQTANAVETPANATSQRAPISDERFSRHKSPHLFAPFAPPRLLVKFLTRDPPPRRQNLAVMREGQGRKVVRREIRRLARLVARLRLAPDDRRRVSHQHHRRARARIDA